MNKFIKIALRLIWTLCGMGIMYYQSQQSAEYRKALVCASIFVPILLYVGYRFKFIETLEKIDNRRALRNSLISGFVLYVIIVPYLYFKVWNQPPDFPFINMMLACWVLGSLVFLPIEIYRTKKKQKFLQEQG